MRLVSKVLLCLALLSVSAVADDDLGGLFKPLLKVESDDPKVSAVLVPGDNPGEVELQVKIVLPEGSNTYWSRPQPIRVQLRNAEGWEALEKQFRPDHPPKEGYDPDLMQNVDKFTGTVVLSRKYRLPQGTTAATAALEGKVDLLVCGGGVCAPKSLSFSARAKGPAPQKETSTSDSSPATPQDIAPPPGTTDSNTAVDEIPPLRTSFTPDRAGKPDPVHFTVELSPATAQPGETVTFYLTAQIDDGWRIYGLEKFDSDQIERPTEITVHAKNLEPVGSITADPSPEVHVAKLGNEDRKSFAHESEVTWRQEFRVSGTGPYGIQGAIFYQVCRELCLAPRSVDFAIGQEGAIEPPAQSGSQAEEPLLGLAAESSDTTTISSALLGAFLAGLLMNIMPCVLPVLAIKILSLVQQAGESRMRIISLNLAYTAGVLAVFFAFAILSWGLGKSLGAAFQNSLFMAVMACVVFTMGLSLFGVFEFPIPGILPSASHHQEGYAGAFNTGVIATILGTPCIAPLVAPFFTWTLTQPTATVFSVFGMMGLGMACPYLLTGIFPELVNWLPRPGMWMVRFKQFTGFVMMGTVIFLLYSVQESSRLPVLIVLLSLGLFVWMWGTFVTPAPRQSLKVRRSLISLLVAAPVFAFGIWMVGHGAYELPWQPFTERQLKELRLAGKPMLIDFTANWCVNCKVNERVALNTARTAQFVRDYGIVPLLADFTEDNPEIRKWLNRFGQDSVPLTIIVPPGKDSEPIPLRGLYSQGQLLKALETAVSSGESASTAGATQPIPAPPHVGMSD